VPNAPVVSLNAGRNDDLIAEVARLYLNPDQKIADLTYGKGVFWKKTPDLDVTGSDLVTVPDRPYDFRSTPYPSGSFDVAVLDPPYIHSPGKHNTAEQYQGGTVQGMSMRDILQLYRDGMTEALRITRPQGFLLVKTKDTIEHGRQVWSHVHLHNIGVELGMYPKDLFYLATRPPIEQRWNGTTQKHSRKNISQLWVFQTPKSGTTSKKSAGRVGLN